jgi:hypothetical protein
MFVGKLKSIPWSGPPEMCFRCFTWVGSCLTLLPLTKQERSARDEHFILLGPFVSYKETEVL